MDNRKTARKLAEESIVLLKNNEHVLPFSKGKKAAFFGRTQIDTIYSGNGSGAAHASASTNFLEACVRAGICVEPELKAYYAEQISKEAGTAQGDFDWEEIKKAVNSGIMYEIFGRYHAPAEEYRISEEKMEQACRYTDTAVLFLGRNSGGEECDRHLEGDYYLTDSERELVAQVCENFNKVVLILNINGLIDLSWIERYESIKSILFVGVPGEEGAAALANILTGTVNPSGKLPVTIARQYEDYPSALHFTWDKENTDRLLTYENYGLSAEENGSTGYEKSPVTVYREDIYAGYRYFDTFSREPLFAFGFGLSYTDFEMESSGAEKKTDGIEVRVHVRNVGSVAGREVVQLYLSACDRAKGQVNSECSSTERAFQELKGFAKTKFLEPGEAEEISIFVPWREWACYDEEQAAWLIRQGDYRMLAGNSSRDTREIAAVCVKQDILTEQCTNRLGIQNCNQGKIEFLSRSGLLPESTKIAQKIDISPEDVRTVNTENACYENDKTKEKVKKLSLEQLAALCVGYGPGIPFAVFGDGTDPETIYDKDGKPLTTNSHPAGFNGYVSPAIVQEGIHSVFYKDGPAGIGETAWPSEMLIACAFDRKLWYEFGNVVGTECEKQQVDVWLAPAVNLHRHPLGGRNFEYFSEDPYLTGICACEVTRGVQENHPVLVCPKHFAVNEQETFRRGSSKKHYDAVDSILSERAARELYLKPFEMLVRDADISCIMTSFNKINGVFAGGNADLCTHILKEEWGYQGVVVTDWGDMDVVVDGADAVSAGNDIVMPGGPPVIRQILQGYQEGRVSRENLEDAVMRLLYMTGKGCSWKG